MRPLKIVAGAISLLVGSYVLAACPCKQGCVQSQAWYGDVNGGRVCCTAVDPATQLPVKTAFTKFWAGLVQNTGRQQTGMMYDLNHYPMCMPTCSPQGCKVLTQREEISGPVMGMGTLVGALNQYTCAGAAGGGSGNVTDEE